MQQITSRRRASALSTALLFVGLAVIAFLHAWWPGIMLVIGGSVGLRQFLLGYYFNALITAIVFCGVFFTVQLGVGWEVVLPVLFVLAALYILLREFQESREHPEDIEDEDLNHEIEETSEED